MKYIKTFENHAEYEVFTATTEFILPNVSHCENENDVHYNPLVIIMVSGVTLDKGELSLSEGDSETLIATVSPSDASNKNVVWSSSDESVATVSNDGVVTAIGGGNADITVTTEDGGFTAQCEANVKDNSAISYTATEKLPETTDTGYTSGLHINSFNGTSSQRLTMVSHTFNDGVGTVTFNGDIAKFGNNAFYGCSGLTSINIPSGVTSIGNSAFTNCSSLTSIDIHDGVTSIGDNAFYNCSGLTSCTIGSGVTIIGAGCFQYCTSLTSINIPDSVTSINNSAFYQCSRLTSIVIPNSVTTIGSYVFRYCTSLTSIVIPDSVTSISYGAFQGCTSLTSITSNATTAPTIESGTFQNVKTGGTLYVPQGSTGYGTWMYETRYYLGYYSWTKVEQ